MFEVIQKCRKISGIVNNDLFRNERLLCQKNQQLMSCHREIAPAGIVTMLMQHSPTLRERSRSSASGCNGQA